MLQLKEPYIGVTYALQPSIDKESGGVRAVPVLSGVLHVEPDGNGGIMLVMQMPTGNGSDFAIVTRMPRRRRLRDAHSPGANHHAVGQVSMHQKVYDAAQAER